jgi:histone acetyltransferase (RNA polymerase elongator complex component)
VSPTPEELTAEIEARKPAKIGFFGGPPPSPELVRAAGLPFVARVRPDLLSRAALAQLADQGALGVELDALTFVDPALRLCGRHHRARLVEQQLEGIRAAGLRAGIVLAPGLPGTTHTDAVADAERIVGKADVARLHPVLVLRGSRLARAHREGRYTPLTLAQAVTTCGALLEILEAGGVEVARVGLQARHDGYGRAVAGPRHPSLRQLVAAHRVERLASRG